MPVMEAEGGLVYPSRSLTARLELRLLSDWKLHVDGSLVYHSNTRYLEFSLLKFLGLPVLNKHAVCLCSSGTWVLRGGLTYFLRG